MVVEFIFSCKTGAMNLVLDFGFNGYLSHSHMYLEQIIILIAINAMVLFTISFFLFV